MFGYSTYEPLSLEDLRSRSNRNQADDETSILKGLPIRQWRLTEETIGPPVEVKPDVGNKGPFEPLPLPRDFHLLPEISQQLLRKARNGQIYHSPKPPSAGKDDKGRAGGKEAEGIFVSKKWTLVARDQEAEEPTYLAKRRKGLPPTFGATLPALIPQVAHRTAKVKKVDADGKVHVYEVLAPEGQQVEGEIIAEDEAVQNVPVEPVAAAPGTVVEGVGVVNEQGLVVSNDLLQPTPPRRKPPPPRRKPKKGPGRGKKKVVFDSSDPNAVPGADGATAPGLLNVPGVAAGRATDSAVPSSQGDTPMPDAGDDDEGSGSEGEEGDDGEDGREEGELSPTPEPETGKLSDIKDDVVPLTEPVKMEEDIAATAPTEVEDVPMADADQATNNNSVQTELPASDPMTEAKAPSPQSAAQEAPPIPLTLPEPVTENASKTPVEESPSVETSLPAESASKARPDEPAAADPLPSTEIPTEIAPEPTPLQEAPASPHPPVATEPAAASPSPPKLGVEAESKVEPAPEAPAADVIAAKMEPAEADILGGLEATLDEQQGKEDGGERQEPAAAGGST